MKHCSSQIFGQKEIHGLGTPGFSNFLSNDLVSAFLASAGVVARAYSQRESTMKTVAGCSVVGPTAVGQDLLFPHFAKLLFCDVTFDALILFAMILESRDRPSEAAHLRT